MNPPALPREARTEDLRFLQCAIDLATQARTDGNRPFGAVLVDRDGTVVATAKNTAVTDADPTGHAEANLVRTVGALRLQHGLAGSTMYASTEPCLMCAGAIYLAGIGRVVFALSSEELAAMPGTDAVRTVPVTLHAALALGDGLPVVEHLPTGTERDPHEAYWATAS